MQTKEYRYCPHCHSQNTILKGLNNNKSQRYACKDCGKRFSEKNAIITNQPVYTEDYNNGETSLKLDKKKGKMDFREMVEHLKERQNLHEKASSSQSEVNPIIKTKLDKIILLPLSDLHIGSIGTDYESLITFTDFILKYDNIYTILVGDLADNFVNFKNMLAVHQMILSPEEQDQFIEVWLKEIKHKVLASFWGNHEEFEEKASGRNIIKRILKNNVPYINGIGEIKVLVNNVEYKIAATHKTRYFSSFNLTHGLKRLAQMDLPNEDIYISGDKHNPALEIAFQRGKKQIYIQLGTLKVNDGYAKRYFSYYTSSDMPCIVLNTKENLTTPFWTVKEALDFCNTK